LIGQLGDGNRTDATLRPLNIPRDFSWSEAQKTLYISDTGSGLILSVDNQGFRNVYAGIELSKQNSVDYFTAKTSLITPIRIAVDHRGVVYFTNTSNGAYFVNQIFNPTYPIRRVVGASNTGMDMNFYLKPYYSDGTKIPMYSDMMDIVSYEDYLYFSGSPYMGYPPSSFIGRLHTIDLSVTIIAGGYTWYLNNIWKPKVKVVSVDFNNGIAVLDYYGKEITIKGDAVYWLNADWGVRLGNIRTDSQQFKYDRLELLKKGMVVEYLQ
jgi:hypothetical protein